MVTADSFARPFRPRRLTAPQSSCVLRRTLPSRPHTPVASCSLHPTRSPTRASGARLSPTSAWPALCSLLLSLFCRYVHRAGRTARAGAAGEVYTLLREEDARHFKAMLRKARAVG
jgi:hypothetical protein